MVVLNEQTDRNNTMTNDQFSDLYLNASAYYEGIDEPETEKAYDDLVNLCEEGLTEKQEAIAVDLKAKGYQFNY